MIKNQTLPLIVYDKITLPGGVAGRPDSAAVMRKAIDGHPVQVSSSFAYINLYHVFNRLIARDKKRRDLKLVRQQVGPTRWILRVIPDGSEAPREELDRGYDPRRGHNKRLAERLAKGESVRLPHSYVGRVLTAWRTHTSPEERHGLKAKRVRVSKDDSVLCLIDAPTESPASTSRSVGL